MQAAQALIELAKNDYAVKGDRLDASQHSNYYTYDLALAFAQHAWKIACYEAIDEGDTCEDYILENLRILNLRLDELYWEF